MITSEQLKLRHLHPYYYRDITIYALIFLYISIVAIFGLNDHTFKSSAGYTYIRDLTTSNIWGIIYGICSLGILWSTNFSKHVYTRIFLGIMTSVLSLWSLAFLFALLIMGAAVGAFSWIIFLGFAWWGARLFFDPLVIGPRSQ